MTMMINQIKEQNTVKAKPNWFKTTIKPPQTKDNAECKTSATGELCNMIVSTNVRSTERDKIDSAITIDDSKVPVELGNMVGISVSEIQPTAFNEAYYVSNGS